MRPTVPPAKPPIGYVLFTKLVVKGSTGDPSSPVEGALYVNTADNKLRLYADGAWRDVVTW